MSPRLLALLASALALFYAPAAEAVSLDEYREGLVELVAVIREAKESRGADRQWAIEKALATLSRIEKLGAVETPFGQVEPYLGDVRRALEERPPNVTLAERQLASLIAQLNQPPPTLPYPNAGRALQDVLDDPRFSPTAPPTLLQRAWERIVEWFRRIFGGIDLGGAAEGGLTVTKVLIVVACLALLGGSAYLLLRAGRERLAHRGFGRAGDPLPEVTDSASMLAAAREHAHAGDYRGAVRANFVALLLALSEQGRLRYERSLTNREHLSRIGRDTPLAGSLRPVVRTFDDVWYGNERVGAAEYERYQQQTDAIRAGAS